MRFAGMDLEARQFAILAALLAPLAVGYRLGIFEFFGLSGAQIAVIAVPLSVLAVVFAFVKWDGRDFYFLVSKKAANAVRPKRLVWRGRPPDSMSWLRDAVQRYLPAEVPVWDMLKTSNGTYLRILEVEASSLSLASEEQKERMRYRLARAYTSFDFPVTEITRSRPSSMGTYLARLRDELGREVTAEEISAEEGRKLKDFGEGHIAHVQSLVRDKSTYEHSSFIVITYNPQQEEAKGSALGQIGDMLRPLVPFLGKRSKHATRNAQREADAAYRKLTERVESAEEYYGLLGLNMRRLGQHEMVSVIQEMTGAKNLSGIMSEAGGPAEDVAPTKIAPTVTLTDSQYASLSDKALSKRIDAAEEVRSDGEGGTPPVIGLGELAVNDRIAADEVEVHSDYIKVGSVYRRTLFVFDMPDSVRVGFLSRLTEMKDRVTLVKYIKPVPTGEALDILGRKKAQLIAAEHTTSQGNVLDKERMRLARESVEFAHREIGSSRESYHELSVLVHIEEDSLGKLDALTQKVKGKLDELRAHTKTAREEMWEGYVSCLPFGENHLVGRYCTSGVLTKPLSCFSTFSSLQLNHERGVLYGTDQNTNATVMADDKKLPNRHKIVLGGSGMGKTVLVKALSTRSRLRGETNVLIDPEGKTRYETVAKRLGGQFVKLGQGSSTRINPFDLPSDYPDLEKLGDSIADEESPEEALRKARAGAFNSKLSMAVALIGLMATSSGAETGTLPNRTQSKLEKVITELYRDKGIGEDPDTHYRTPPVMGEFFEKLTVHAERDEDLTELRESLYRWEQGSLQNIFDGHTNVDLRSKYLVFRIAAGENGPEKAPLMFVLLDFLRGRLADPKESITCWIDEMWSLLYYPMAVDLLNNLWRASRASNTSMVGITQDLEEFLESAQAETLMRQSQTYVLLGQSKNTVEKIGAYTELSAERKTEVSFYPRGEALLIAGRRQLPIKVSISAEEERLFNTDPDKDEEYRRADEAGQHSSGSLGEAEGEAGLPATPPTLRELAPYANGYPAGRIYALAGSAASEVAFSLSGLLAAAASQNETGGRVLLVDASGVLSRGPLAGYQGRSTDELLELESQPEASGYGLDHYLVEDPEWGLRILPSPETEHPDDARNRELRQMLIGRMKSEFDAVVVACAPGSSSGSQGGAPAYTNGYAGDWLLESSRTIVVADTARELAGDLQSLESYAEFHHRPLLALTGADDQAGEGVNLPVKSTIVLPDGESLRRSMEGLEFASVEDESATGEFARLAQRMST
jgi:hypothetical protein